ncbi:MAG: VWA domain-containing protein [Ferruginibacter sp.]|nr:VWA domain-containing protein [Ferruginibacter sp.]
MKLKSILPITGLVIVSSLIFSSFTSPSATEKKKKFNADPKIQVAILLDVSGSMDGLIEQAKAQLWNMVNTLGKAKCDGAAAPKIEIALYEYGRSTNDVKAGYVKQINSFINDMDSLSENLFSLRTNGGDEYCGQVIYTSLQQLQWDANPENYKVIFIAGNEDFLQGSLHYTKACTEAKSKGIIVNTIYCGDRMQGIREHWNLAGECGNGSFTSINQNAKEEDIPTPYDSLLVTYNSSLNNTYITYGFAGASYAAKQGKMDVANAQASKKQQMARIKTKANAKVYDNSKWDLVDANNKGVLAEAIADKDNLPDSLKNKSKEEIKKIVDEKGKQRAAVNQQITELSAKRDAYIADYRKKQAATKQENTMETEVEKIIKEQAKRYRMQID